MADEYIDILDKYGKATGEIRLKSEAHKLGLYHASTHIWFYTIKGTILFQKRVDTKDTYPGLWDVSVAGHIETGETPINAAIREIKEEIGLMVSKKDLELIRVYHSEKKPHSNIYDNEFQHIFLVQLNVDVSQLSLQKEEVSDVKLVSIIELENIIKNNNSTQKYVPHGTEYFSFILKNIINRLPK